MEIKPTKNIILWSDRDAIFYDTKPARARRWDNIGLIIVFAGRVGDKSGNGIVKGRWFYEVTDQRQSPSKHETFIQCWITVELQTVARIGPISDKSRVWWDMPPCPWILNFDSCQSWIHTRRGGGGQDDIFLSKHLFCWRKIKAWKCNPFIVGPSLDVRIRHLKSVRSSTERIKISIM